MNVVSADPLRESAQRVLVEAHLAEGNVQEARRAYDLYRRRAVRELRVEPGAELTALLTGGLPPPRGQVAELCRPPQQRLAGRAPPWAPDGGRRAGQRDGRAASTDAVEHVRQRRERVRRQQLVAERQGYGHPHHLRREAGHAGTRVDTDRPEGAAAQPGHRPGELLGRVASHPPEPMITIAPRMRCPCRERGSASPHAAIRVPPNRTFQLTNAVESMISICRTHGSNVKNWRDGRMALRWCAAGVVEAGKQFRRINGHMHLRTPPIRRGRPAEAWSRAQQAPSPRRRPTRSAVSQPSQAPSGLRALLTTTRRPARTAASGRSVRAPRRDVVTGLMWP